METHQSSQDTFYIKFVVPGKPRGKERPRFTKTGFAYTPKPTTQYQKLIASQCKQAMGDFEGWMDKENQLRVEITCCYPIPNKFNKAKRMRATLGLLFPTLKPDLDNVTKAILDGMNRVAYYDDSQVVSLKVEKVYAKEAKVEVAVYEI